MVIQAPVKVSPETNQLLDDASYFLGQSKKDIVDAAVREYIDNHRAEINDRVSQTLTRLDGSVPAAVALLTGMSAGKLDELGGF